ncbi:MAG: hypothetical protein AAB850_00580 [Patescibacteria group bacterium]
MASPEAPQSGNIENKETQAIDDNLVTIESRSKSLANLIAARKDGTYIGHASIEEDLKMLKKLTDEALHMILVNPDWYKTPYKK